MKIKTFLLNREAVDRWLDSEREIFERSAGEMVYSLFSDRIDIQAVDNYSGEFTIYNNGNVEMIVEDEPGEVIYTGGGMASNEKTLFDLFDEFKKKLKDENT